MTLRAVIRRPKSRTYWLGISTLSQKCGRLMAGDGWRSKVARYLCANWLDPFQMGGHCRGRT